MIALVAYYLVMGASRYGPAAAVFVGVSFLLAVCCGRWIRLINDEAYLHGHPLTYGRCDTCGSPCDHNGCTGNRRHLIAIP